MVFFLYHLAASGKVVFASEEAERLNDMMQDTILVRVETSPEDIHECTPKRYFNSKRGMTSHAAVVARGMGRPCVSGSRERHNWRRESFKTSEFKVKEGDGLILRFDYKE